MINSVRINNSNGMKVSIGIIKFNWNNKFNWNDSFNCNDRIQLK
jgi:hypothetical protein